MESSSSELCLGNNLSNAVSTDVDVNISNTKFKTEAFQWPMFSTFYKRFTLVMKINTFLYTKACVHFNLMGSEIKRTTIS